jgi:hypothetical protein
VQGGFLNVDAAIPTAFPKLLAPRLLFVALDNPFALERPQPSGALASWIRLCSGQCPETT